MFNLPQNIYHLEKYYNSREIILLTAEQIKKDFNEFSFSVTFNENSTVTPYHQLYNQLLPNILKLLDKNTHKLYALLYRIDVSEKTIKDFSLQNEHLSFAEIITELILQREMKKIITRLYFKDKL